jgi:protoporphyrinogen oxidase
LAGIGMPSVLVLGAGPAGLSAAMELASSGRPTLCMERESQVGGLAKTYRYGEFRTDMGPHRFFSQNRELYRMIGGLLGERWIQVDRLTRFYIGGKFFKYPVQMADAIKNTGPLRALKMARDYLWETAKRTLPHRPPESVEEELVSNFGRTLAELNMLNYTQKVWGLHPSQISPDWTKQRIKGLSLKEIATTMVKTSNDGPKTLVSHFYYPDAGAGLLYETMRDRIDSHPQSRVLLNAQPKRILHDDERILEVETDAEGSTSVYAPDSVISSIPVTKLLKILHPPPPPNVMDGARRLRFRSHVSLFITLRRESVFPDQWIYFPETEIPFGRIMEPKNFSRLLSPPHMTSLLIEFFCWEGDDIWNSDREDLLRQTVTWLDDHGFIKEHEVQDSYIHRERYAYPVYDLGYKAPRETVLGYFNSFNNLQLIGRSGIFQYNNQDHAIEMGMLAARNLLGGGRLHDIEKVGTEQGYLERGYLGGDQDQRPDGSL